MSARARNFLVGAEVTRLKHGGFARLELGKVRASLRRLLPFSIATYAFVAGVCSAQTANKPVARADANSQIAHTQLLEKAKQGGIDIYFVGDSITRRWGASDLQYTNLLANWNSNFFGWNAANFGWGADRIENILWRLENGELDSVN